MKLVICEPIQRSREQKCTFLSCFPASSVMSKEGLINLIEHETSELQNSAGVQKTPNGQDPQVPLGGNKDLDSL